MSGGEDAAIRPPVPEDEMARLLAEVEADMTLTSPSTGRSRLSPAVTAAFRSVPRHCFLPQASRPRAYQNCPLSIGNGQTISQPFIVALMTELLDLTPDAVVLDVGTGSGYQAAVLSGLVNRVVSMERIESLAESARKRLSKLGFINVEVVEGDGYAGWPDGSPYNAILVAATAPSVPGALLEQLACGGRMIIPIGDTWGRQQLRLIHKGPGGSIEARDLLGVAFVPLVPG